MSPHVTCGCPRDRDFPSLPCAEHFKGGTVLTVASMPPPFRDALGTLVHPQPVDLHYHLRRLADGRLRWLPGEKHGLADGIRRVE